MFVRGGGTGRDGMGWDGIGWADVSDMLCGGGGGGGGCGEPEPEPEPSSRVLTRPFTRTGT